MLLKIFILLALTWYAQAQLNGAFVRGCYFTNWAQYRPGRAKYVPEDYVKNACTHVFFAFGWMTDDFRATNYDPADIPTSWAGEGMYARVNKLKNIDTNLKTLLSFGGWTFGVWRFQAMANVAANRKTFIDSSIAFTRQYGFDGIDVDWEFPQGTAALFTTYIKELRAAIDKEVVPAGKQRLLLTAAVHPVKSVIDHSYDVPAVAPLFDFVNVMTYDFHGSWEGAAGQNSPLYARAAETDKTANIDYSVKYWIQKGLPASKYILGIGTYGRGYTLANSANRAVGAAITGVSAACSYTAEAGLGAYFEICEFLAQGAVKTFDTEQQVPYLSLGNQWFGYDDVQSVKAKTAYVKAQKLGGAFVWTLDQDDFNGQCSNGGGKKYPLIGQIASDLGGVSI